MLPPLIQKSFTRFFSIGTDHNNQYRGAVMGAPNNGCISVDHYLRKGHLPILSNYLFSATETLSSII